MIQNELIDSSKSLFVCIDIQEKLLNAMAHKQELLKNANILLQGAQSLQSRILITEQYPKGLGKTDSALSFQEIQDFTQVNAHSSIPQCKVMEKISFSIFGDTHIRQLIQSLQIKSLIFFGIESHICVLQSAIYALKAGFDVWVIEDALSSRSEQNHINAVRLLSSLGAKISNTESILFGAMLDSKHKSFKTISALVK